MLQPTHPPPEVSTAVPSERVRRQLELSHGQWILHQHLDHLEACCHVRTIWKGNWRDSHTFQIPSRGAAAADGIIQLESIDSRVEALMILSCQESRQEAAPFLLRSQRTGTANGAGENGDGAHNLNVSEPRGPHNLNNLPSLTTWT